MSFIGKTQEQLKRNESKSSNDSCRITKTFAVYKLTQIY